MIMRITWGKLHRGTWRAYEQAYNDIVVAKSRAIQGLQGRWLAQDVRDPDAGYAIADPQTLGQIRPALHKEVQDRLVSEVGKTLTKASVTDIQEALN